MDEGSSSSRLTLDYSHEKDIVTIFFPIPGIYTKLVMKCNTLESHTLFLLLFLCMVRLNSHQTGGKKLEQHWLTKSILIFRVTKCSIVEARCHTTEENSVSGNNI
jgi:hypothetical protein